MIVRTVLLFMSAVPIGPTEFASAQDSSGVREAQGSSGPALISEGEGKMVREPAVTFRILREGPTDGREVSVTSDESGQRACLTIKDVEGTYTIPYIQSGRTLRVSVGFTEARVTSVRLALLRDGEEADVRRANGPAFEAAFEGLPPGEYILEARGLDANGREVGRSKCGGIGVGAVLVAMGDSITEGYYWRGFLQQDLDLTAGVFPAVSVSRDGRNFPQFAPTTHNHLPEVNCFESWMTRLNDLLAAGWEQPVFIANEGWGGISSGAYLALIRGNRLWRERMRALKPNLWLIHLGVNDERSQVAPDTLAANLEAIVNTLIADYGASPDRIFVAKPSYDYFEGAKPILESYCTAIDELIAKRGLRPGPDLFAAYAADRERWYGADPVHPNKEGMDYMARLWHGALIRALPKGPAP